MPNSSSLPASGIGNSHAHGTASQPPSREPLQPHVPVPLAPTSAAALESQSLPTSTTTVVPLQAQTQIAAPSPVRPSPSRLGPRAPKSEGQRLEGGRLPLVMEHEEMPNHRPSGGSSSGSDEDNTPSATYAYPSSSSYDGPDGAITYTPTSSVSAYTPSTGFSSGPSSWNSYGPRPRGGSGGSQPASMDRTFSTDPTATQSEVRGGRPGAPLRTPSNTYAPPRRPPQFLSINSKRMHSSNQSRSSRRDPNAQYKAQEKAYVQRVRQQPQDWLEGDPRTPSIGFSTDDETDDESPSAEHQFDDPYDPETLMFLGHEDNFQPSEEELQNPQNRERLEWHSMLASVLKGDVVKQEKQRLIGTTEQMSRSEIGSEIWIGARAKYYGRPLQMQRKLIEEGRAGLGPIIESLIAFEIKGETVVGKSPLEQVQEAVANIEKIEWLYSSRRELEAAQPRAASDAFRESCDAIVSWHNITQLINTELAVLQAWVGNPELDFTKQKRRSSDHGDLSDDSSFIDRILKEDGLKSLQGDKSMFNGIGEVITKAKSTLIENAEAFAARHLPPYIEELLTLINFPSRLIQEIIRMRLSYARKMKESAQQSVMIIDQMIAQFQILMNLACLIKRQYLAISHPEPGWDLPPCIDENFDSVIVEALKFYFKMLNWKLGANKNTFREAEILEQEWGFSNEIGRQLEGGDIEVAEQFSSLTAKSLLRLTASFERELRSKPEESPQEMEKRYKTILDSVRVRQRKLFRFSRILRQRFENATEFNLSMDAEQMREFTESLILSGHFLVEMGANSPKGVQFVASPSLWNRPKEIQSILGTSFHADDAPEDPSNPYILIIRPEDEMPWEGPRMDVNVLELPNDVRLGRLRLVADGSSLRLQGARMEFANAVGRELDVVIEQRANLSRVNLELGKIKKTTFKLSNTIMESVEVIRSQNGGIASPELVQSCFAFATEFGKRSLTYMDPNRRMMNNLKLTRLALDWVSFICDDCDAADRRTFKWAVVALEFAMAMTRGRNILDIGEEDYKRIRVKVAGCMSVLISHFDIMGARSTLAAQQEKSRMEALSGMNKRLDFNKLRNDEDCRREMSEQRLAQLNALDQAREERGTSKTTLGRVLEGSNEADRSLTFLSSSATNITMRWQQGQFVGGGTFGSVYAALNLDTGTLMAVKEIRLQDPQLIPTIVKQIGDEMGVLAVLDHPNIVSYYGIEVHRDKVYIFMEYCSGGSVAGLLEHGRIEDETVIMVYALQMLEGLAYLHQAHIVHRDIKPENVLLDHNGVIKYVDFGAAKIIARQGQTMMGQEPVQRVNGEAGHLPNNAAVARQPQKTMTGTPMYMSPEVIRGDSTATSRFSGAADIWSLGCVILEMATGRRPWSTLDNEWAIMYNIAQGNPPQLPTEDQLSPMGIDFLKKCFERDPAKRSTAAELLQHPWIVEIRRLVVDDPDAQTPRSDTSTSSGGAPLPFRQNSASS
ncbi:Suppressor of Sensor Kinase (SLN1) [Exophiala dermatitidis]|uniref:MAP kinase kinase kinase n=2 Tax=Exophiala dermatitidis TaxID=5970 RepID=H6BXB8_EXODN|nr:mitogen-activated protein kinase kinase kinase [Exophiala dermatitidis NIH/UT8656]KAJ4503920.1 Suppressor of Sensor Kinase (SLN1) [Exophiala dermatitidis]EHY56220.1 mitogen-activated protein kinase kinase kinase [Exophiala dermatitidis NIH/UT8656]KAJ4505275.1 Suppressor of Sensor Kinase (SLN1) [Exophiala dermatitidis]KAJ4505734.1 Suppressor of Sensor Kinase (SLN1) [Exophiala dermatitidis]KAJ4536338.1 Suppressor of Sensor Kinase (SLN1) [Exophiala dermatitidis]